MTIKEKVEAGIQKAMKSKDTARLSVLRMIKSELLLKEKESGKRLDDPIADQALQKMYNKYRKAKDEYQSLGKHDEADIYARDLEIIESFLSAPLMSEDQIRAALATLVEDMEASGPRDFGNVMKAFMSANSNADGKTVSSMLKEILNKQQPN